MTNWENPELSDQQQRYAATDAWASLQIYLQLMMEKKLTKKQLDKILFEQAEEQRALRDQQALNRLAESAISDSTSAI